MPRGGRRDGPKKRRGYIVRKRPVNGPPELDPNKTLPATDEEVEEAESMRFDRMMREPPLGLPLPALTKRWRGDRD